MDDRVAVLFCSLQCIRILKTYPKMSNGTLVQMTASSLAGSDAIRALDSIALGDAVNPWHVVFRGVTNFALEHVRASHGSGDASSAGGLTWQLAKSGDLMTSLYLQVDCPQVVAGDTGDHVSYVWGLGYAMITNATLKIANVTKETITGQWMEMHEELHQPAGIRLQEAVLKMDRVTAPEMQKITATPGGITLYVPLPFFWTKGAHCALPVISMSCHDIDVTVVFRSDSNKKPSNLLVRLDAGVGTDNAANPTVAGVSKELEWSDFSFSLWCGTVHLDNNERNFFAQKDHQLLMKTVHSYSSTSTHLGENFGADPKKTFHNISFTNPVSSLVWAIADRNRHAKEASAHNTAAGPHALTAGSTAIADMQLYEGGVRALYGAPASLVVAGKVSDGDGAVMDWNVLREGAVEIDKFEAAAMVGIGTDTARHMSSTGVKEWRRDGLNGCLHLPGNPFDYRMTQGGVEIEPMESFKLTFNGNDRVDTDLKPEFYRTVQGAEHFANVPRKGIYCYSFAKNASSPYVNGVCNFSKISDKSIEITKNTSHVETAGMAGDGDASQYEVHLYAEHFNIFQVKNNAVGLVFA